MLDNIKTLLPEFAKDIRLNWEKIIDGSADEGLNQEQILGACLAVALALNDKELIAAFSNEINDIALIRAAKLATSLMAMTNIYYRFIHLSANSEVAHIPPGLRMQGMANPGIAQATFELLCLAVSAINGCGMCISAHTQQLIEHGFSAMAIARIGRISAVINAVSVSKKSADIAQY